jgi:hypothetical protein
MAESQNCFQGALDFLKSYKERMTTWNHVPPRLGIPNSDLPRDIMPYRGLVNSVVNGNIAPALKSIVFGILPEIKGKINLAGVDCGGMMKAFQRALDNPDPEKNGLPADFRPPDGLRELLKTAQKIAEAMG